MIDKKLDMYDEVLNASTYVLEQYIAVIPLELSKKLLLKRAIDYRIELMPKLKPPS